MSKVLKRILAAVLVMCIATGLVSCAALRINESEEPAGGKTESQKRIPLPPTIKDFETDSE
ncbi:MAG: hypothetical protein HY912_17095 [Desulfomonile tiedjei]|uniref:Lipoprotein n=1 Tax=Desulfomonile tiedjei TaxID=2358 RepID=A0A9D6V5Q4_9BACT|nr:hypothetical protein [Desulfomonile tiedjei]